MKETLVYCQDCSNIKVSETTIIEILDGELQTPFDKICYCDHGISLKKMKTLCSVILELNGENLDKFLDQLHSLPSFIQEWVIDATEKEMIIFFENGKEYTLGIDTVCDSLRDPRDISFRYSLRMK